jgi:hypothetical protein
MDKKRSANPGDLIAPPFRDLPDRKIKSSAPNGQLIDSAPNCEQGWMLRPRSALDRLAKAVALTNPSLRSVARGEASRPVFERIRRQERRSPTPTAAPV